MEDLSAALAAARTALMEGDKATARAQLATVLRSDPGNAQAWLLMSGIVTTPDQQRDCLRRVLALDPANAAAQRGLAALEASPPSQPPAAPAQPPSGIRQLEAAPTPAPAPPAEPYSRPSPVWPAPSQPAATYSSDGSGWGQPSAPIGGMPPAAAPGFGQPPAIPDQYAPQSGTYGYPPAQVWQPGVAEPRRGMSPLLRSVIVGVVATIVILCGVGALVTYQRRIAPPTPKISAQDRATGFMNELFSHMTDPRVLDPATAPEVLRPTIDKYVLSEYRDDEIETWNDEVASNPEFDGIEEVLPFIKQIYVADMRYSVREQTATRTTLDIIGGDLWFVGIDGQAESEPITTIYQRIYLVNDNGVWYIRGADESE
jgi:hypothetical protein